MAYKRMREEMLEIIAEFPVIAAVKDEKELKESLMTDCKVIFILFGNI